VEISLSHSTDPQLTDMANSKISSPLIKRAKKPSKQRPQLAPSQSSRATLEKTKKESW